MGWFDDDSDSDGRKKEEKKKALPSLESILAPEEPQRVSRNGEDFGENDSSSKTLLDEDPLDAYMKSIGSAKSTSGGEPSQTNEEARTQRLDLEIDHEEDSVHDQSGQHTSPDERKSQREVESHSALSPDPKMRSAISFASDTTSVASFRKRFWHTKNTGAGQSWRTQNDVKCSLSVDPILDFEELQELFGEPLMETIKQKGYQKPTLVQAQTLPVALSGHDVLVTAATGQGKTLSYIWPLVVHILDQPHFAAGETGPIALVLVPTRELAQQVFQQAKIMLKPVGGSAKAVIGGQGKYLLHQELKKHGGVELVVATPGRFLDVCSDGKKGLSLQRVTVVVLDEADKMLQMGFEAQVRQILSSLRRDRQTLMLSATMGKVEKLGKEWLAADYSRISVGRTGLSSTNVDQHVIVLTNYEQKESFFLELLPTLEQVGRTLVFVSTREGCERLAGRIQRKVPNLKVATLHGDKHQSDRSAALRAFARAEVSTLIATDVAGRGLDIPNVATVVCFDPAKNLDTHVHRIGRAGRLSADTKQQTKGNAYTLLTEMNSEFANSLKGAWERENRSVPEELRKLADRSKKAAITRRRDTSWDIPKRAILDKESALKKRRFT